MRAIISYMPENDNHIYRSEQNAYAYIFIVSVYSIYLW